MSAGTIWRPSIKKGHPTGEPRVLSAVWQAVGGKTYGSFPGLLIAGKPCRAESLGVGAETRLSLFLSLNKKGTI